MTIAKYTISRLETGYLITDETPDEDGEAEVYNLGAFSLADRAAAFAHLSEILSKDEKHHEDWQRRESERAGATVLAGPGRPRRGSFTVIDATVGGDERPDGGESA